MEFNIKNDPHGDAMLVAMPLGGAVSLAIAADLNRSGHGRCCSGCGKPFNAARKQRGVGRVRHVDAAGLLVVSTAWVFCGACLAGIRRNGGRIPSPLVQEAREAASAALLLGKPAEGCA